MGARYFDTVSGRFMRMDPVGFDETNPESFNGYQYVINNPYRYVDPNGQEDFERGLTNNLYKVAQAA